MDSYTEKMLSGMAEFYEFEAENKLPQIIASFRGHGAALSDFLDTHGYNGEKTPEAKAQYLREKFIAAGIGSTKARNALVWLNSTNGFERDTGFRIAFALNLSIEETNEFFRVVMLDRSFDCHTVKEAIYYYCFFHGKNYQVAEKLISRVPKPDKIRVPDVSDILYTRNIIIFLQTCSNEESLIGYFHENLAQFGYNQVKAKEFIRHLWKHISVQNGLAAKEREFFLVDAKPISQDGSDSTWNIFLQILGLDLFDVRDIETDRTIKPILENQTFMHQFASDNFPNRQSIEKILRGESTQHDLIRKTLIMLSFYHFWINTALSHNGQKTYEARKNDHERCIMELDQYLLDAGFPEMYAGNPFDWIFLWAAGRESPMQAFRSYWQLLSAEYSEHVNRHKHPQNQNHHPIE